MILFNAIRKLFRFSILERMLYEFIKGSTEGSFLYKLAPMPELYSKLNGKRIFKRNDLLYKADLTDLMDWAFYWGFSDSGHEFFLKNLKQGETVIDVGANKGKLASQIALKVGRSGKVIAYEANPSNYAKCLELINSNKNKLAHLRFLQKGCGNKPGEMSVKSESRNNTGMDRLVCAQADSDVKVDVVTLDTELCNIDRLDWIKIDTEGYELKVLEGAVEAISKFKPKMFIEFDKQNLVRYGDCVEDIISLLAPLGYTFFNVQESKYFMTEKEFGSFFHFDCFCSV